MLPAGGIIRTEEVDNNSMIAQRKILVSVMGKKPSKRINRV